MLSIRNEPFFDFSITQTGEVAWFCEVVSRQSNIKNVKSQHSQISRQSNMKNQISRQSNINTVKYQHSQISTQSNTKTVKY